MKKSIIFSVFYLLTITLFFSCKGKNEYTEENKQLVLVRCNFTNLSIKYTDVESVVNKEIDCLCYLDKIQREFTQEEYFQMLMNPEILGKDKTEKIIKFQKECEMK
jgi:hypothetical protein